MKLETEPGSKVRYLDENGYDIERELAKKCGLVKGELYTVERVIVHSWSSDVYLQEIPHTGFNTVMFENAVTSPAKPLTEGR